MDDIEYMSGAQLLAKLRREILGMGGSPAACEVAVAALEERAEASPAPDREVDDVEVLFLAACRADVERVVRQLADDPQVRR